MITPSNRKRYFARILVLMLVLILIVSVAFNLYDAYVNHPKMQATMNDMRVRAFRRWLNDMDAAAVVLEGAETPEDFRQAELNLTYGAEDSSRIILTGIDTSGSYEGANKNPYLLIYEASGRLQGVAMALGFLVFKNSSAFIASIRLRFADLTSTVRDMRVDMRAFALQDYGATYTGADLVQRLQDKGKLTDFMNYCDKIIEASAEIMDYAYTHLPRG